MSVRAQTVLTPVTPPETTAASPVVISHTTPELDHIRDLFLHGLYPQLVKSATEQMELDKGKGNKPDPELLYWRGFALRRCGLFNDARGDLKSLGNMTGASKFASAAQLTTELDLLIEQRPLKEHEVCRNGKVLFRVYCDEDDEFLQTVLAALPKGYDAASEFVESQTTEIPIFVFNSAHYSQFVKFFTTLSACPLQSWWRVGNWSGTITISQNNALEPPLPSNCPDMARLMSHEITHQLIHHIVGDVKDFPAWFNEGMARCGEGAYDKGFYAQNNQKMGQLLAQNALLPLELLTSNETFYHSVEQMKKGRTQADAYAQGFSMTRYLGVLLEGNLHFFLDKVRRKKCFEAALKEETGMTVDEFYDSWLAVLLNGNR